MSHATETIDETLLPVRMLNEFVYCPRLAYLEWTDQEFAASADTVDGTLRHRRVDKPSGKLPEQPEEDQPIHARSVALGSAALGLTGKLDLVEGEGREVIPVDYKRGKRPHVQGGVYDPERVQLCAQGLLLREHGYRAERGWIYFCGSKERVPVEFDEDLVRLTLDSAAAARETLRGEVIPAPLEDSPKCPRCSLVGICLPDELRFLKQGGDPPRPILPADDRAVPLYVQSPKAYLRKDGDTIVVEVEREKVAEARLNEVSQIVLFGNASLTTPLLHECFRRDIAVTWLSYGGWFVGHGVGLGHRNVETRSHQFRASFDPEACLRLARGWVAAKIANCRTLLRRNWRGAGEGDEPPANLLAELRGDARHAENAASLDILLGIEGAAAARYFRNFRAMLKAGDELAFDFSGRHRRPPPDPVNALLSFAYAMLAREWTVALSAVGLDPYRGFYHQPRFGRPSLALDLMEPFRPLIADSTVLTVINNGEIGADDFVRAAGSCALKEHARKRFIAAFERRLEQEIVHPVFGYRISYRRTFEVQARLLIRHVSGELPEYPNFLTR